MSTGQPSPEAWERITERFGELLELPSDDRSAFLERLRRTDPDDARELASLLDHLDGHEDFLPALPSPQPPNDLSGRAVGAYRLLRLLGSGGMGAVYLAARSDGAFSKLVAIKLLSSALVHTRHRFLRERDVLAKLEHPNITRLIDGGVTADGLPYLVMEYVEGVPIDRYCTDRELSLADRIGLIVQVCAGIAHAHQNLVVHRDVKPENILVTADGRVKLLDFGIAKLLDEAAAATLHPPATPAYSSPEQLRGDPVTTAGDVYSIGVLAYVLLTGRGPYALRSGRLDEIVQATLTAEPKRASQMPDLPPPRSRALGGDLDTILLRAVARDPDRRYASVQQLADDFDRYQSGFPVLARTESFGYRARKAIARHPVGSLLAALAVTSLIGGTAVSMWQARVADRRFDDLRRLARSVVFDLNDSLSTIPGTTAARKLVVETALTYLDRLSGEGVTDPELGAELAAAYIRVGKVQGGAFLPNLGDSAGAVASFRKAVAAAERPRTSASLERLGIEAHINIALLAVDPVQGVPEFDAAIRAAGRLLARDPNDVDSLRLIATAYHGRATIGHLTNHAPDNEEMSRREIDVLQRIRRLSPDAWQDAVSLTRALGQLALALGQKLDHDGALVQLQRARTIILEALDRDRRNQQLLRTLAENRDRSGGVLVSLGRLDEARAELDAAVQVLQPLVDSDPQNRQYRADLSYVWLRLGDFHRAQGDWDGALAFHTRALAMRRERAERDPASVFVPWELTRSLNAVGECLLALGPRRAAEAQMLFEEALAAGQKSLVVAPSFSEVRKQVANAYEGLARVALMTSHAEEGRTWLEKSVETWRDIAARSVGDQRDAARAASAKRLLASLSEPRSQ